MLAVARQAIDYVSELAQGKMPVAANTLLRERASAQAKFAQAEAALQSGRLWLYDIISEAWEATVAGKTLSLTTSRLAARHDPLSEARCRRWSWYTASRNEWNPYE